MNSLAESVLDLTDKELLEEFGADPPPNTKDILRSAAKVYGQGKLQAARLKREQAIDQIQSHSFEIPNSPSERRVLLDNVLASQFAKDLGELTVQFRELGSVPDGDVESTLRQLDILGVLRKFRESSK